MKKLRCLSLLFALVCLLAGCATAKTPATEEKGAFQENLTAPHTEITAKNDLCDLVWSGSPYAIINDNKPFFSAEEITATSFESYASLDALGRCGAATSSVGQDLMPTEDRGSIGQVKPSGWQTVKYDIVDGKYLYNRCHLIGFQLTGENANTENLITGTRYMNVEGMLPFENMIADFVKETGMHVMYRVTPVFYGEELVARGVLLEAISVEDGGEGIEFCVWCFNTQPGIKIDYATGDSRLGEDPTPEQAPQSEGYILNTNSKKIHKKIALPFRILHPRTKKKPRKALRISFPTVTRNANCVFKKRKYENFVLPFFTILNGTLLEGYFFFLYFFFCFLRCTKITAAAAKRRNIPVKITTGRKTF